MKQVVIALVLALATRADAAMMEHFDLAGLLMQSEAVVVADRVGPSPTKPNEPARTRYHVTRVLAGAMKVGTELDIWDQLYDKQTAQAILFVDAKHELVRSGYRAIENGKVYRFEQWRNPGGWTAVPQGTDPVDMWRGADVQLDVAGFERALAAAAKRVAAFTRAKTEPDRTKRRAAILALFPPPGGGPSTGGFYADELAGEARDLLGANGDVEGALMVALRDRSGGWQHRDFAPLGDLLAYAADATHDSELRAAALGAAREVSAITDSDPPLAAVVALIDDPAPTVRSAAIAVATSLTDVSGGDAALEKRMRAFRTTVQTKLAKRFATESDTHVLAAIAAAFHDTFKRGLPARKTVPPFVGRASVSGRTVNVDIRCLTSARVKDGKVVATANGIANQIGAINLWFHCGANESGLSGGVFKPLPAGTYELTAELATKSPTIVELGTLVVDADHDMHVVTR